MLNHEISKDFGTKGGLSAAFYTLGCRVNQYETQSIEDEFRKNGFEIKSFDEECDVYVINTCTVTAESDRKSRQIIRRTALVKKPGSLVIVCGCYSQENPAAVAKIEGIDAVFGNAGKSKICEYALSRLNSADVHRSCDIQAEDILRAEKYESMSIERSDRTRAFVKIVDGCENHCTYCIIPSVRGKVRSRKEEDILCEIKRLAEKGYKEVVLTGIETAAYGKDFEKGSGEVSPLAALLEKVNDTDGIERIRLGSMEPTVFTEEFVRRISCLPKVCPHFHLSLQSGSDEVLRNMKRKYNTEKFLSVLGHIRTAFKDAEITTDIIVGFPGETEELFCETCAFVKKAGFAFVHIFPYSDRSGTPASKMEGKLSKSEKKERVARLESIMLDVRRSALEKYVGREMPVLLETEENGTVDGYTENYIRVVLPLVEGKTVSGKIRNVKIVGIGENAQNLLGKTAE